MTAHTLLFVDDDHDLSQVTAAYLREIGFNVEVVHDGSSALRAHGQRDFDAVVLDVEMPYPDGHEVMRRIRRARNGAVPVIMLSGKASVEDRIVGLNAGADDYLTKPFSTRELHARLDRVIQRSQSRSVQEALVIGDLRIDVAGHYATRSNQLLVLSPTMWRILVMLARASPKLVTRQDIEEAIWGSKNPTSDILRGQIHNLRKVVDHPFERHMIKTVTACGFRLAL